MKPGHCCILLRAWKSRDLTILGCRAENANAKSHTTVKNTLHIWVKYKRNFGKLKERCEALRHKRWRHLRSTESIALQPSRFKISGVAQGPLFSWNLGFFEIAVWVHGVEGTCSMLWLGQLDLDCRDDNITDSHQPLLIQSGSLQGPLCNH